MKKMYLVLYECGKIKTTTKRPYNTENLHGYMELQVGYKDNLDELMKAANFTQSGWEFENPK